MSYILDTNIVSAILKENERVKNKLREVRIQKEQLFISCITYYRELATNRVLKGTGVVTLALKDRSTAAIANEVSAPGNIASTVEIDLMGNNKGKVQ